MTNPNRAPKEKTKRIVPPDDREKDVEQLAEMVVTAGVLFRQAEGIFADLVLAAAKEMTVDEHKALIRSVAQATRPYSAAMIRRVSNNSEVFGQVAPIWGAS